MKDETLLKLAGGEIKNDVCPKGSLISLIECR